MTHELFFSLISYIYVYILHIFDPIKNNGPGMNAIDHTHLFVGPDN